MQIVYYPIQAESKAMQNAVRASCSFKEELAHYRFFHDIPISTSLKSSLVHYKSFHKTKTLQSLKY